MNERRREGQRREEARERTRLHHAVHSILQMLSHVHQPPRDSLPDPRCSAPPMRKLCCHLSGSGERGYV